MKIRDFSLRIDDELLSKLRFVAKFEDRSMNQELIKLIRIHVENFEKRYGPIPREL